MRRSILSLAATALCLSLAGCVDNPYYVNRKDLGNGGGDSARADGRLPLDGWPADGQPLDGLLADGGGPPCTAPANRALRLFFIGNSFTLGGPIPTLVRSLAASAGWPAPEVRYSAQGGYSLRQHRSLAASVDGVAAGNWDFVVLQEYSTKPTDNAGNPAEFKEDATWWYDQTKAKSPGGWVILYETWARHKDHSVYPGTFTDPAQMQAQLRKHYNDAANNYIPTNATAAVKNHVKVAPCGDAWEMHLAEPNALRLHASDNYHAGDNGAYLNAAVIYSTIYGCRARGLSRLMLPAADAARLQDTADRTTGIKGVPPGLAPPKPLPVGSRIQVDFGSLRTTAAGWNNHASASGATFDLTTTTGQATSVDLQITTSFLGGNTAGRADNLLGWPSTVSQDNLYCGSSTDHADGLKNPAQLELQQLAAGSYRLDIFASRAGKDGTMDRLTRYTVGGVTRDLDATDNVGQTAIFGNLVVPAAGKLTLDVAVSPAGTGRFAYINALVLRRLK